MAEEKRRLQVWLPADLMTALAQIAEAGDRTVTQEAARAIREHVRREQKRQAEATK